MAFRCGATFNQPPLGQYERETLRDIERLAKRLAWQSEQLFYAVASCQRNNTTEGLSDMVAYSFNSQQFTPQYGGVSGGLPAGPNGENVKYKVVILNMYMDNVEKNGQVVGGFMAIEVTPIDGPLAGQKHTDRLNLHNTGPNAAKVIEIANKQLSAYSHVTGKFTWQMTEELYNIPFWIEIGLQKEPNPNKYTEVKALFDVNGNEPGKAGAGPQAAAQQQPVTPPAAGVQASSGWGGGAPAGSPAIDNGVPLPVQTGGVAQGGGWQGGAPSGAGQPGAWGAR